jgi:hypothetical protein
MLSGLLLKAMNKLRRFFVPVDCPACGHRFKPFQDQEFQSWRDIGSRSPCPKCGYKFGVGEDAKSLVANPAAKPKKPGNTKIQRFEVPGDEVVFLLPAGKTGVGMIVMGALLCAILLPLFYKVFVLENGFSKGGNGPRVLALLFTFVSVMLLYGGLRQRFATYRIDLGPEQVRVRRDFLLRWTYRLPTRAIDTVRRDVAYTIVSGEGENEKETKYYAIVIGSGLRFIRFGTGLGEKEQLWLAREIRDYLRARGATGLAEELPEPKEH